VHLQPSLCCMGLHLACPTAFAAHGDVSVSCMYMQYCTLVLVVHVAICFCTPLKCSPHFSPHKKNAHRIMNS
jgi:hypothetical protein